MTYNSSFDIIHISDEELFLYLESEKSMKNLIKETVIYKKLTSRIYDEGESLYNHEVTEKEVDAIEIPNEMTNGDIIKLMFGISDDEISEDLSTVYVYTKTKVLKGGSQDFLRQQITFVKDWWNEPYKKGGEE